MYCLNTSDTPYYWVFIRYYLKIAGHEYHTFYFNGRPRSFKTRVYGDFSRFQGMLWAGKQEHHVFSGRRGSGSAGGGRHAHLADNHPKQRAMHPGHIHRVVERSSQEAQTVHAGTDSRWDFEERWTAAVRALLLWTEDGGGRLGGGDTYLIGRRTRRPLSGRLFLYRWHKFGEWTAARSWIEK